MSATRARAKRKTGGVEASIKRYLSGILFIIMGALITGAISYIASIIPAQSFPPAPPPAPTPTDPFNGTIPSGLSLRQVTNITLNNQDSFTTYISGGVLPTATVYVVVDLNTLNGANVSSSMFSLDASSWNSASGQYYKCNYYVGYDILGLTSPPANYVKILLNKPTTANATVYIYVSGNYMDFSNNLVCYSLPKQQTYSVSNTLLINFIGWSFGIVVMVVGVKKLGVRI